MQIFSSQKNALKSSISDIDPLLSIQNTLTTPDTRYFDFCSLMTIDDSSDISDFVPYIDNPPGPPLSSFILL